MRVNDEQVRSRLPKLRSKETKTVPVKDERLLRRLDKLMNAYAADVGRAELADGSKTMYIDMADCFVRWVGGKFQPGIHGVCSSGRQSTKKVRTVGARMPNA